MSRPSTAVFRCAVGGLITLLSACEPSRPAEATPGTIALTTTSEEARALYLQGQDAADQIRFYDAHQLFLQAVAKDPSFALAHYGSAFTAPTDKEFRDHLSAAVALADEASEGERLLILTLQAGADADGARSVQYAEELVAKYPQDARAHFILGNAYSGQQRYAESAAELQRAVGVDSTFAGAYNLLGYSQRFLGNYAEAETAFKKYIELLPNDPNPYDSYAELLMKTGRFDESIEQYRKALSVDPAFSNSRTAIAWGLALQSKYDEAIAETQQATQAARDDADRRGAIFSRTAIYLDQGKTDLALKELDQQYALGAAIGDTAAMAGDAVDIGNVLLESGKVDDAAKRFQQALDLVTASSLPQAVKDDATLAAHYDRARVALRKGDLAAAKAEAGEFLSGATAKNNAGRVRQAHEIAGMIAIAEKRFDPALAELAQANQQDPYVLYTTALALQGKGDRAKATETFRAAADMNILPTLRYAFVRTKAKQAAG